MLRTKICGITRLEDAEFAVSCGADALGFVFWPKSPRAIDPERARSIVAALPQVVTVGVFVNQTVEEVNQIAGSVPLSAVQLHGDESVAYAARIERPVLKAIAVTTGTAAEGATAHSDLEDSAAVWPASTLLLLDVHDAELRGGTGRTVDWSRAAAVSRRRPVVLAGGLRPENVLAAINAVHPFGIDVSSGVEERPGVKDRSRIRALFDAIVAARVNQTSDWEWPVPEARRQ